MDVLHDSGLVSLANQHTELVSLRRIDGQVWRPVHELAGECARVMRTVSRVFVGQTTAVSNMVV